MRREDLETPALTVDLDVLEDNIARMQAYADEHRLKLRPHIKTHKIPAIAHRQVLAGAVGITCQKLGEAEVMVAAGLRDIFISYNIVGQTKLERLARLARQARMRVAVDSLTTVRGLADYLGREGVEVGVVVELESTHHRCGVTTAADAVTLARAIADAPALRYEGVMIYPSNRASAPFIEEAVEALRAAGLLPQVVSGGGTPEAPFAHEVPYVNEVRPGTYVYNDWSYCSMGVCTPAQCALNVIATVVSAPTADRVIIDGGSKTFTNDGQFPMGHICEYPDAQIPQMSEEHGFVDVSRCARKPRIGERLTVIPNHACATSNLHDRVYGLRGNRLEVVWEIQARGKVQ
ncbi:MAG: alanine racemase [Anaerolineae bacterium]|nr:alanine racemase [Anaerolineae bacterium]